MQALSSTIATQLHHRSIRQFTEQPIAEQICQQLIDVARMSSSSNHLQCISIVRITDMALREQIMACASHQVYIKQAPEFWVFCVDFAKHQQLCEQAQLDYTEVALIGAVDAGIMAQNVMVAAESLGLGGVFIGALRNHIEKVGELLHLPPHCFAVLGLCLGYPDQNPPQKPRLPQQTMCFENQYQPLTQNQLDSYNQDIKNYYQQRGKTRDWYANIAKTLAQPVRPHILPYLQQQGFMKK
ncbi:oxygen-insensitive NADPH nitroreductase [Volucribacter amazonae]|uniref:Nitroreductase A n=1 Tax=Volucribacter amazonae TaxID=256731 RepID=A0A9X4SHN8_9PAST|nr:oxygen-insensitive NADPH nitroreductase [Volucribacter amazonae]MDG6894705.1 nitroreductase A [Volucribacter amazonae]